MSDRPTPLTAPLMHAAANESIEAMFRRGCDLERKLAEALEKIGPEETWRADAGWKRADEAEAKLAEAREALEWTLSKDPSPCRCVSFTTPPHVCIAHKALARINANEKSPSVDATE